MNNAKYIEKTIGYEAKIETTYKELEQIKYELDKNNIKIMKIEYKENIEISIEIPEDKDTLIKKFNIKKQKSTKKYVEI